jgi:hypothetical protein
MTHPKTTPDVWKWATGLIASILVTASGAVAGTASMKLSEQEARLVAVEKAVAVYQTDLGYIKQTLDEVKEMLNLVLREHNRG